MIRRRPRRARYARPLRRRGGPVDLAWFGGYRARRRRGGVGCVTERGTPNLAPGPITAFGRRSPVRSSTPRLGAERYGRLRSRPRPAQTGADLGHGPIVGGRCGWPIEAGSRGRDGRVSVQNVKTQPPRCQEGGTRAGSPVELSARGEGEGRCLHAGFKRPAHSGARLRAACSCAVHVFSGPRCP